MPGLKNNAPSPTALFGSLRALNYSVESSIADIVDNSVSANAARIAVDFTWNNGNPTLEISDDGDGMSESKLVSALRLAGDGPDMERNETDLGRFGLGLKTASIAHCRRFTVSTIQKNNLTNAGWDLDLLEKSDSWEMTTDSKQTQQRHRQKIGGKSGTVVMWQNFDRLLGSVDTDEKEDVFNQAAERTFEHLGMVFSRFLLRKHSPIVITVNEVAVRAWDPALSHLEENWPQLKELRLVLNPEWAGTTEIKISSFVLPREEEFPDKDTHKHAGLGRWNSLQGFFVYRADRLIYDGGYLGLGIELEEHAKLGRIVIDIPNSRDHEWALNVTKEALRPPRSLEPTLRRVAKLNRKEANRRYRKRATTRTRRRKENELSLVWSAPNQARGIGKYVVNRSHPMIAELQAMLNSEHLRRFKALITLIERSLPIEHIAQLAVEEAKNFSTEFNTEDTRDQKIVLEMVEELIEGYLDLGYSDTEILKTFHTTAPFNEFSHEIEELLETARDRRSGDENSSHESG